VRRARGQYNNRQRTTQPQQQQQSRKQQQQQQQQQQQGLTRSQSGIHHHKAHYPLAHVPLTAAAADVEPEPEPESDDEDRLAVTDEGDMEPRLNTLASSIEQLDAMASALNARFDGVKTTQASNNSTQTASEPVVDARFLPGGRYYVLSRAERIAEIAVQRAVIRKQRLKREKQIQKQVLARNNR
jgi:hypothetical protein